MMVDIDEKESLIINHYLQKIEQRSFDEYDILGFLIVIRRNIKNGQFEILADFADLIAHRKRCKGIVLEAIRGAIDNDYSINDAGTVVGYAGIQSDEWRKEWNDLAAEYHFILTEDILNEIMLCLFSLTQYTQYEIDENRKGTIYLFVDNKGYLYLATTENLPHSPFICFSKWGEFNLHKYLHGGMIESPVHTKRENGVLQLIEKKECILS